MSNLVPIPLQGLTNDGVSSRNRTFRHHYLRSSCSRGTLTALKNGGCVAFSSVHPHYFGSLNHLSRHLLLCIGSQNWCKLFLSDSMSGAGGCRKRRQLRAGPRWRELPPTLPPSCASWRHLWSRTQFQAAACLRPNKVCSSSTLSKWRSMTGFVHIQYL